MAPLPRRTVLAGLSTATLAGLAGCSDAEAEFIVTNTQRVHSSGHSQFDYPDDILYRVTIENTGPSREHGTLEMTLTYDPGDGQTETWDKADDISLGRGSSVRHEYVFDDVYVVGRDIDDYGFEAEIVGN